MLYFVLVLSFSMFFTQPVCLAVSLVCSFIYSIYLKGGKAIRFSLFYMLPMLIVTALLNPIFNHQGSTILFYLKDGNPLTLESIMYGIAAAVMMISVISWFSCYNVVMTSDKFVYLFGRIIPALSLILSMVLRFVPRFKAQLKNISNAQRVMGRSVSSGSIVNRTRHGVRILSIMTTWALENAVETADSMKSRGYGLPGRTAFSIYKFEKRDKYAILYLSICALYIITCAAAGGINYRYFPTIKGELTGYFRLSVYTVYFALCVMPTAVDSIHNS